MTVPAFLATGNNRKTLVPTLCPSQTTVPQIQGALIGEKKEAEAITCLSLTTLVTSRYSALVDALVSLGWILQVLLQVTAETVRSEPQYRWTVGF